MMVAITFLLVWSLFSVTILRSICMLQGNNHNIFMRKA
jgi:hypothetical protein